MKHLTKARDVGYRLILLSAFMYVCLWIVAGIVPGPERCMPLTNDVNTVVRECP